MILAQYTIRAKQDYIFKTNRVLEIIGASENIARIWDVLFELAENTEVNLKCQRVESEFSWKLVQEQFEQGCLNAVELFCGGGNETILFDSKESFNKLNKAFSLKLLEEYPGMIPMVVSVEVKGNYSIDYEALMEKSDVKKNTMLAQDDIFTVPFAMMDRTTFQPYSKVIKMGGKPMRITRESYKKHEVGQKIRNKNNDVQMFDEMITNKGKESLLAVVHADGNNMGAKIMQMLKDEADYDVAVSVMRKFTKTTADCFEVKGGQALKACHERLLEQYKNKLKEHSLAYRKIIGSGDDMTFICNARFVMEYVKAYLEAVQNYQKECGGEWNYSSCAGICIFHSHYPFSRAYSIAEQACDDGAKQKVHVVDEDGKVQAIEQGWMDFHFIHSGIGGDLSEIRDNQGTGKCIARPWLVSYHPEDESAAKETYRYEKLLELKALLDRFKVARTHIKTIGSAYERSESAAKGELVRLYGHTPGMEAEVNKIFNEERDLLKALYDYAEIVDLWYDEVK